MIFTKFWVSCFLLSAFMKISPISFFSKYKIVYVCAFCKYSNIFFSHSKTEAGPPICLSASSLLFTIVFLSSLRYCGKSLTSRVLLLVLHQKSSPHKWWLATSFLTIHLRLVAVFVFSNFYNFSWNIFHIHQKQLYMLQNSLSCKILLVIISAKVFPIQKRLCKIASLSKIRWEFLEIFSSTLWPFSAISLFFFTWMCSTWFLFSSRFIEVCSCPFSYFSIFPFLWISLSIRKEICRNVFRTQIGRTWAMSQEGL